MITLDASDIEHLYRHFLLNSKLIDLIENPSLSNELKIYNNSEGLMAVFNPHKQTLYFAANCSHAITLEIFRDFNSKHKITTIEASEGIIEEIAIYLKTIRTKYRITNMVLMVKDFMDLSLLHMPKRYELVKGKELIDFKADILIREFALKMLNTSLTRQDSLELIASSAKEFWGLKASNKIVSVAAWVREIKNYRCLSYVYTDRSFRNKGFAQIVLSKLINDTSSKYKGVFLFVDKTNNAALNLYTKIGFTASGYLAQLKLDLP